MTVIDDVLAKDPEHRTVEFCLDRELRESLAEAQVDLDTARAELANALPAEKDARRSRVAALEQSVDDLTEQAKARMARFTFAAVDPEEFERLKAEHAPTKQQRSDNNRAEFNVDTFPPVLVAAACVKVETPAGTAEELSVADANAMWHSRAYNDAERALLFNSALAATTRLIPLRLETGRS